MNDAPVPSKDEAPSIDELEQRLAGEITKEEMMKIIEDLGARRRTESLVKCAGAAIDKQWFEEAIEASALAGSDVILTCIGYDLRERKQWALSIRAFATALNTEGLNELRQHFIQYEDAIWISRVDEALAYCKKETSDEDALDDL